MPQFESGTLAIGFIFPYQNPVSRDRIESWLEENEFDLIEEESQQELSIGPRGLELEGEEGIAKKGDIHMLYQPNANLNGFPNSSFITVKNIKSVSFEDTIEVAQNVTTWLEEELDILQDVATREVTIQGLIRTGATYDLTRLFNSDTLGLVESIGGHRPKGITARFESEADSDTNDWYRILIDKDAVGNPNLWGVKIVTRYERLSEIGEETVETPIDELIEYTLGE